MEENTRQRVSDISEINMEIDETAGDSVHTDGLALISGNISPDITVPAISTSVNGHNPNLTDSILLPKVTDFCNTSKKTLTVGSALSNLASLLEEPNIGINSTSTGGELKTIEYHQLAAGTVSNVELLPEMMEDQDSLLVNFVIADHQVEVECIPNPVAEMTKREEENAKISGVVEEKPNVLGFTSEDEESCVESEVTRHSLSTKIEDVELESSRLSSVTDFNNPIRQVASAWSDFRNGDREGFTKGCKWSPDGLCLLTNSEDNALRVFELPTDLQRYRLASEPSALPEMKAVLRMSEGGLIYDYCWYPLMSSVDPATCCLASTAQDNPVHLWDAYDGSLRATYRAYNQVDEVEAAACVTFNPSGDKIYCGFKDVVRVFDTAIPGRECDTRTLKDKKITDSQRGIVSCITVNPNDSRVYAVGTYLRSIGLYSEGQRQAVAYLFGHGGGLTQLSFSPDGARLYSGGRKDNDIICWDLRNSAQVLFTMQRQVSTNQRIQFDVTADGNHLVSGGTDGVVTIWDLAGAAAWNDHGDPVLPAKSQFHAHGDCVNGVSVHDRFPVLATSSGQRHFPTALNSSAESLDSDGEGNAGDGPPRKPEDCVKLWWTGVYE